MSDVFTAGAVYSDLTITQQGNVARAVPFRAQDPLVDPKKYPENVKNKRAPLCVNTCEANYKYQRSNFDPSSTASYQNGYFLCFERLHIERLGIIHSVSRRVRACFSASRQIGSHHAPPRCLKLAPARATKRIYLQRDAWPAFWGVGSGLGTFAIARRAESQRDTGGPR